MGDKRFCLLSFLDDSVNEYGNQNRPVKSPAGNSGEASYYGPITTDEVKEIIRQIEHLVGKLGQSYEMD